MTRSLDPRAAGIYPVDLYGNNSAAVAQAVSAMGAKPGVLLFGAHTYNLTQPIGTFGPTQSVKGLGKSQTLIRYSGAGDCIRAVDPLKWGSGGAAPGGEFTGFTIDGTNAGPAATGLHIGDMTYVKTDVLLQNFAGIGAWLDNQHTWTERLALKVATINCGTAVQFDVHGGYPSFSYSDIDLSITANANQNGVIFTNNAGMMGSRFSLVGNFNAGDTNTATVLTVGTTPTDGALIQAANLGISVETDGVAGVGHKDIQVGAAAYLQGIGVVNFLAPTVAFTPGGWRARSSLTGIVNAP